MNLIFDFDGTIADSLDDILDIANGVLTFFGKKPVTKKEIRNKGTLEAFKARNIPKIILPLIVVYGRWRVRKVIPQLELSVSISVVLNKLVKKHKLGIITSNSPKNVKKFLKKNFKKNLFDFIQSDITYLNKERRIKKTIEKYKLKPSETVYIGDETRDIKAAKAVGIKSIAVTWGFESGELLKKVNPDYLIRRPEELPKILQSGS